MSGPTAVVLQPEPRPLPDALARWLERPGAVARDRVEVIRVATADALLALALRGRPAVAVIDARGARGAADEALAGCARLKRDSYTAVVPAVAVVEEVPEALAAAFAAGADEVLRASLPDAEAEARLGALLRRSTRDTGVHPTTRLPGTPEIEAELDARIGAGVSFAACYADLDHFKEYNDRYGYNEGDRVIRMLALILHDVVKGMAGEDGFVGHIGGDDFIFVVSDVDAAEICGAVVETFDALVPLQYSEADRRAGYYFGKDRRGQLHRVPLMSVSIGVVTTERRRFTRASQVSELASEMKSYAKSKPGSLFAVDRRHDDSDATGVGARRAAEGGSPQTASETER